MSRKHTKALETLIDTIPGLGVFVTVADRTATGPYVVIHPASGVNTQERVTAPRSSRNPRFTLHVVGESADQVQFFVDGLEELLFPGGLGVVISVEGERGFPLWFEQPLPVQALTDPQPTVIYGVIECGWRSDPVGGSGG